VGGLMQQHKKVLKHNFVAKLQKKMSKEEGKKIHKIFSSMIIIFSFLFYMHFAFNLPKKKLLSGCESKHSADANKTAR
jgi:uncharacterized membrane protein (DUF106 family)